MKNNTPTEITNGIKLEDRKLLLEISKANKVAFEILFHRYYGTLCKFGASFEPRIDIVEEMVSDVFLTLWNGREKLPEIANVKAYLYVSVKNNLLKAVKQREVELSVEHHKEGLRETNESIEQQIIEREQRKLLSRKIERILEKVPKKSRQVFEMSRLHGLKYREISEILNISVKTVENHMALALKTIRHLAFTKSPTHKIPDP